MRSHPTWRRFLALPAITASLLQGCSSFGPSTVGMPQTADITTFANSLTSVSNLQPADLVNYGYAYVDNQCNVFFIALQKDRNIVAFTGAQLAALGGLAVSIMTLVHAGLVPTGIVGGAFGAAATTALNYSQFALLTEYDAELQDLVHAAQNNYKSQVSNNQGSNVLSLPQAYSIIQGYAFLCTLPGIDSLARQALSTQAKNLSTSPLSPTQITAIAAVGAELGLSANDALTADQAAALVVFFNNGNSATSNNVRQKLSAAQKTAIFKSDPGTGTLLTVQNPAAFSGAMSILSTYEQLFPAFGQLVTTQTQAIASGNPALTPSLGGRAILPELNVPGPSLGVVIPQIQMR